MDIATEAKAVADVTGAGDTVMASLAGSIAAGESLESACRLANSAAGVVVAKVGISTVTPRELAQARAQDVSGVVLDLAQLQGRVQGYQAVDNIVRAINKGYAIQIVYVYQQPAKITFIQQLIS